MSASSTAPLALAITEEEPVFAIDYKIAQAWWVKPFLKLPEFLPLNPAKPMATRTLIKIVQDGDPLGHLPRGPHDGDRHADEGL